MTTRWSLSQLNSAFVALNQPWRTHKRIGIAYVPVKLYLKKQAANQGFLTFTPASDLLEIQMTKKVFKVPWEMQTSTSRPWETL